MKNEHLFSQVKYVNEHRIGLTVDPRCPETEKLQACAESNLSSGLCQEFVLGSKPELRGWLVYDKAMQLALIETSLVTLLLCLSSGDGTKNKLVSCLPEGIKLEEIVSAPEMKSASEAAGKKVTVKEMLLRLKAHCKKGKLLDGAGREIYFYRLIGCWGNPPEDYQEQFARQNEELLRLKKKYRVVEIPCAPADPREIL